MVSQSTDRRQSFSSTYNISNNKVKPLWDRINQILDFLKDLDEKIHTYDKYFSKSYKVSILDDIFHGYLNTDISAMLLLYINYHKFQANILLRHFIETLIIIFFSDLISNFAGHFHTLLSDSWKKNRKDLLIRMKKDKYLPSIEERIERIKTLNPYDKKDEFYNYYFSKANLIDLTILFSLPTCNLCRRGRVGIKKFSYDITNERKKKGKELKDAKFRTDFFTKCTICKEAKDCNYFSIGIPDTDDMLNILKRAHPSLAQNFGALKKIYQTLSSDFVHYSITINPLRRVPFLVDTGIGKFNLWGIESLLSVIELLKPIIRYYFKLLDSIKTTYCKKQSK